MGRQVPNGRQVPSLTSRDMFHLDGRQVPNSRQVPSWTPHDTVCPNGRHVLMGY